MASWARISSPPYTVQRKVCYLGQRGIAPRHPPDQPPGTQKPGVLETPGFCAVRFACCGYSPQVSPRDTVARRSEMPQ